MKNGGVTGLVFAGVFMITLLACDASIPVQQPPLLEQTPKIDTIAEKMLIYQRAVGGWPKAVDDRVVDYNLPILEKERMAILRDSLAHDATFDNQATTREVIYLMKAYRDTQNKRYLEAVEKGMAYILAAQYPNGGWPQFYPNPKGYQTQITYNDGAMIRVMVILKEVVDGKNGFNLLDKKWVPLAKSAMEKGLDCILKTQIIRNGTRSGWCQQYDQVTLEPAKARSYELPSNSANETVGIVRFLMRLDAPSAAVREAIESAVAWLDGVKLQGWAVQRIDAPEQPTKKDVLLVRDPESTIWARYYDLDTNQPFFCGRDGQKKNTLAEIENERRVNYGWYGIWPAKLLASEYPKWVEKWK